MTVRKCDDRAPEGVTRIGLQDDKTTVGSVAGLNRAWPDMEQTLAEAGHRLRSHKCGVLGTRPRTM